MRDKTIGKALVGFAAVALVLSIVVSGSVSVGAIVIGVIGVFFLARGGSDVPRLTPEDFEQTLGRTGPSRGRQLVGEACAACGENIMVNLEGAWCERCATPIHADCRSAHEKSAHPTAAYR